MAEPMMNMPDATLAEQARTGDTAAFDVLLHRHYDAVFAVAMARLRDRGASEDLAQEVFLRAWLNVGGLRDGSKFGPWVVRMARNLSVNWLRAGTRRSRLVRMVPMDAHHDEHLADGRPDARQSAEAGQRERAVHDALAKLSPAERELVVMHFMESASQREIAERLGVDHTTVGRRLEKSLGKMRATIGEPAGARDIAMPGAAAKAAALSVVLAAASMSAEAKAALVSAATASAPSGAGTGLAASSKLAGTAASILLEGAKAMTLAKKIGAAAVAVACIGGGAVLVREGGPGMHRAAAAAVGGGAQDTAAMPLAGSYVYASGTECVFDIPTGRRIELAFADPLMEMEKATLSAPGDGTLVVETRRLDGTDTSEVLAATEMAPAKIQQNVKVQIWRERGLFVVSVYRVAPTDSGMRMWLFTCNKPEMLPQGEAVMAAYNEGRTPKRQMRAQLAELLGHADMLPKDPELRRMATMWIDAHF